MINSSRIFEIAFLVFIPLVPLLPIGIFGQIDLYCLLLTSIGTIYPAIRLFELAIYPKNRLRLPSVWWGLLLYLCLLLSGSLYVGFQASNLPL